MKQFLELLTVWMKKNHLATDSRIYTQQQWRERKEEYHNDADFVIVTEGGLFRILNFDDPYDLTHEFSDLLESFNYYYELGHAWNLGLYKIDEELQNEKKYLTYAEKLTHPLWQKKRKCILERANYKCEDCGANNTRLDVHHCYYMFGLEPWQYPFDALKALCNDCHLKRGEIEKIFRASLQTLTHQEIAQLEDVLETIFWNYDKTIFFQLLQALILDKENIPSYVSSFLTSKKSF